MNYVTHTECHVFDNDKTSFMVCYINGMQTGS